MATQRETQKLTRLETKIDNITEQLVAIVRMEEQVKTIFSTSSDIAYRSWSTSTYYMVPSSTLNVWHYSGTGSTTAYYAFITINET